MITNDMTGAVAQANAMATAGPASLAALRAYGDARTAYSSKQVVRIAQVYCHGDTRHVISLIGEFPDRVFAAEFMLDNVDMFPTSTDRVATIEYAYVLHTRSSSDEIVVI